MIFLLNYGGHFDIDSKKYEINTLQKETEDANFWNNRENAEETLKNLNELKELVNHFEDLKKEINNCDELLSLLEQENEEDLIDELNNTISDVSKKVEELRLLLLLNGPYDKNNCILEIHPGSCGEIAKGNITINE